MEPRARSAGLLSRRTLAWKLSALRNWTSSSFVRWYSHILLAPGSGRTRYERRRKYACGATRSCFYPWPCAREPVHDSVGKVLEQVYYAKSELSSVLARQADSSPPMPDSRTRIHPPLGKQGLSARSSVSHLTTPLLSEAFLETLAENECH